MMMAPSTSASQILFFFVTSWLFPALLFPFLTLTRSRPNSPLLSLGWCGVSSTINGWWWWISSRRPKSHPIPGSLTRTARVWWRLSVTPLLISHVWRGGRRDPTEMKSEQASKRKRRKKKSRSGERGQGTDTNLNVVLYTRSHNGGRERESHGGLISNENQSLDSMYWSRNLVCSPSLSFVHCRCEFSVISHVVVIESVGALEFSKWDKQGVCCRDSVSLRWHPDSVLWTPIIAIPADEEQSRSSNPPLRSFAG